MDRHQYVKTLIEQRDNLKKEIESINSKIGIAKKRTKDAILNFKPELCYEASSSVGYAFCGGYQTVQYVTLPENELVSDDFFKANVPFSSVIVPTEVLNQNTLAPNKG